MRHRQIRTNGSKKTMRQKITGIADGAAKTALEVTKSRNASSKTTAEIAGARSKGLRGKVGNIGERAGTAAKIKRHQRGQRNLKPNEPAMGSGWV